MLKQIIIATGILLLATNAKASDSTYSWQGAYIGGQIGANWGKGEYDNYAISSKIKEYQWTNWANGQPYTGSTRYNYIDYIKQSTSFDKTNFVGGIYLGYNFQVKDHFIFGVEGDIAWGGGKSNSFYSAIANNDGTSYATHTASEKYEFKSKYNGAFRTRFGYAYDRFLPYFTTGIAVTKVKLKNTSNSEYRYPNDFITNAGVTNIQTFNETTSASKTLAGFTVGLGTDYALTDHVLLRAEYRYTNFGSADILFGESEYPESYKAKYKSHDIRLGVAYKF